MIYFFNIVYFWLLNIIVREAENDYCRDVLKPLEKKWNSGEIKYSRGSNKNLVNILPDLKFKNIIDGIHETFKVSSIMSSRGYF